MHWFLSEPCVETLLAGFGGAGIKGGLLLIEVERNLIGARFGAGEDGLGEGEEEEESLREVG